jgi:formylglycine-generating enzyme required for sulfatase activity
MLNGLEKRLPTEAEWEFQPEEGERVVYIQWGSILKPEGKFQHISRRIPS